MRQKFLVWGYGVGSSLGKDGDPEFESRVTFLSCHTKDIKNGISRFYCLKSREVPFSITFRSRFSM